MNFGKHAGSSGPFREGKGTSFEGGVRVPCIMRWPGQIPSGTECDRMAATMDVLPTLASITGAPLPEHKIDGVNILPLLKGDRDAIPGIIYSTITASSSKLSARVDGSCISPMVIVPMKEWSLERAVSQDHTLTVKLDRSYTIWKMTSVKNTMWRKIIQILLND